MRRTRAARGAASVLLAALWAAGCGGEAAAPSVGDADAAPTPAVATGTAPATGEQLMASPPSGWVETAAMNTPALRMAEYGPPGSVAEPPLSFAADTVERITFEAQTGQPLPDPIDFVLGISRDLHERCDPFYDVNVASDFENGYPTSVRLMICAEYRDSAHGQIVMAKAIQGNDAFYVITRRRMTAPIRDGAEPLSPAEMAEWTTFLNRIFVCDTGKPEHPCTSPQEVTVPATTPPQIDAAAP